jgi:hypothetical protein
MSVWKEIQFIMCEEMLFMKVMVCKQKSMEESYV